MQRKGSLMFDYLMVMLLMKFYKSKNLLYNSKFDGETYENKLLFLLRYLPWKYPHKFIFECSYYVGVNVYICLKLIVSSNFLKGAKG